MNRLLAPLSLLAAVSCAGMTPAEGDVAPAATVGTAPPVAAETPAWVAAADHAGHGRQEDRDLHHHQQHVLPVAAAEEWHRDGDVAGNDYA